MFVLTQSCYATCQILITHFMGILWVLDSLVLKTTLLLELHNECQL